MCVCVYVCVREKERERKKLIEKETDLLYTLYCELQFYKEVLINKSKLTDLDKFRIFDCDQR